MTPRRRCGPYVASPSWRNRFEQGRERIKRDRASRSPSLAARRQTLSLCAATQKFTPIPSLCPSGSYSAPAALYPVAGCGSLRAR
jgi:hypothetical protein